jgi:hypothetical protein
LVLRGAFEIVEIAAAQLTTLCARYIDQNWPGA